MSTARHHVDVVKPYPASFTLGDLDELEERLAGAAAVIRMCEVKRSPEHAWGTDDPTTIALRHDVDHDLDHALSFARWEHERGFRASYYLLHTASYWRDQPALRSAAVELESLGHEVGIHNNAVVATRALAYDPDYTFAQATLEQALYELRSAGVSVTGSASHGDARGAPLSVHNNDMWKQKGGAFHLEEFQLEYEAYFLHGEAAYLSDNHGKWQPALRDGEGLQLHVLVHPCHWELP